MSNHDRDLERQSKAISIPVYGIPWRDDEKDLKAKNSMWVDGDGEPQEMTWDTGLEPIAFGTDRTVTPGAWDGVRFYPEPPEDAA